MSVYFSTITCAYVAAKWIRPRCGQLRGRYVRLHREVHHQVSRGSGQQASMKCKRETATKKFPLYPRLDALLARAVKNTKR